MIKKYKDTIDKKRSGRKGPVSKAIGIKVNILLTTLKCIVCSIIFTLSNYSFSI